MLQPDSSLPVDWDDVIARVREGSQQAAHGLVDALYGHVLRIVRSHLPRAADEQDLSQEIFMKMFARIDSYRGEQPFPHWVARIAVNTCYDRLRRQKSRPEVRFADLTEEESAFLQSTFTGTAEDVNGHDSDGSEVVEKLLSTLNATEQTVLRLLDMEQKSVQEISRLTGWGASKVKVTAMRARRKLNDTLKRLESGYSV
ncbi:MAG TPA: RNA polymerase sigma factor [Verrucomicrobiales bacterium]|jgi:RNA polymerase sigma-70 factor (ECF subfamily)|nr:RNA polymerase sigma factor [Verrucomicrobiales bacterium]